jgi:hypothetical protein
LRHYVLAVELKAAGLDWTEVLAVEPDNPRARLAAELLASATRPGNNARLAFRGEGRRLSDHLLQLSPLPGLRPRHGRCLKKLELLEVRLKELGQVPTIVGMELDFRGVRYQVLQATTPPERSPHWHKNNTTALWEL